MSNFMKKRFWTRNGQNEEIQYSGGCCHPKSDPPGEGHNYHGFRKEWIFHFLRSKCQQIYEQLRCFQTLQPLPEGLSEVRIPWHPQNNICIQKQSTYPYLFVHFNAFENFPNYSHWPYGANKFGRQIDSTGNLFVDVIIVFIYVELKLQKIN